MMSDTNFLFCFALANRWTSMFPLMDDPALCLRDFCSRLQMSGRSYPRITKPRSSLFVGMTEARTHFEESHGQICFGSNFFCLGGGSNYLKQLLSGFNTISHILSKLDCVVAPFLWWRGSLHFWEMARAVPNGSCQKRCPKRQCDSITVFSLLSSYISRKNKTALIQTSLSK